MDGDGCFYLLAFVTEEEGSATHLCKFDAEGNPVYDTDISGETDNADLLTDFLMEIDIDTGKAGASCPDFPKGDNTVLVPGMENTLLSYDRTALSSYDLTSRTGQVLFDWLDYVINGSRVEAVHVQEDGRLLVVIRDLAEGSGELALLKKTDSPDASSPQQAAGN